MHPSFINQPVRCHYLCSLEEIEGSWVWYNTVFMLQQIINTSSIKHGAQTVTHIQKNGHSDMHQLHIKQPHTHQHTHTHSKALVHQTSFKAMGWISSVVMNDPDHNCWKYTKSTSSGSLMKETALHIVSPDSPRLFIQIRTKQKSRHIQNTEIPHACCLFFAALWDLLMHQNGRYQTQCFSVIGGEMKRMLPQ